MENNFNGMVILPSSLFIIVVLLGNCYGYGLLPLTTFGPWSKFFEERTGFWTYACDISPNCTVKDRILLNYFGYGSQFYYDTCFVPTEDELLNREGAPTPHVRLDDPVRCRRIIDPIGMVSRNVPGTAPVDKFLAFGDKRMCGRCSDDQRFNEGWTSLFYWNCDCAENQCGYFGLNTAEKETFTPSATRKFANMTCYPLTSRSKCDCNIIRANWSRTDTVIACEEPIYNDCPKNGEGLPFDLGL